MYKRQNLYFTDPTYGLPRDPANPGQLLDQELLFSGVYLLSLIHISEPTRPY